MATASQVISPPSTIKLALEVRAINELGLFLGAFPLLGLAARGDGHPVVVFPGLLASDASTKPLRMFLSSRGFDVCGWGCGPNHGPKEGLEEQMCKVIAQQFSLHKRKVSLVGWSLGGIYARQLAKLMPDKIRCVITLGSPFAGSSRSTHAWPLYRLASGQLADQEPREFAGFSLLEAPPVPTTAIFSRSDGICAWQSCVEDSGVFSESIEVYSSHCGMGFNLLALYAVADRLAQPEQHWQPFARRGWRKFFFPT
jgi:pimeloyl-ACP methyl ester carboxylesterase